MNSISRVAARYLAATTAITDIGPNFKALFVKVKDDPVELNAWLVKAWEWYNKKYCGGILKPIRIRLQRNTSRAKALGQYGRLYISLHPRIFTVGVDLVLHVLKHEMCHQAVWEIDHVREKEGSNHGPTFFKWAAKFGVKGRYADIGDEELEVMHPERAILKKVREEKAVEEKPLDPWKARPETQAKFLNPKDHSWIKGVLIRPIDRGRWWLETNGYNGTWRVNISSMFELKPEEILEKAQAKILFDRALERLENEDRRRQDRKDTRQMYRSWP